MKHDSTGERGSSTSSNSTEKILFLTDHNCCAVGISESKRVVLRQLMVLKSSYCPDWSIKSQC